MPSHTPICFQDPENTTPLYFVNTQTQKSHPKVA